MILLYEDSVDKNEGEGDDEEDVGEVEDELGDVVLGAVPLHIPVSDAHLKCLRNLQNIVDMLMSCIQILNRISKEQI